MCIGCIQNGLHIVDVVLDFFGEQLRRTEYISAKILHQQTGNDNELYPCVQVVVGNGLKPVTLGEIPGQRQVAVGPGSRGGGLQLLLPVRGQQFQTGEEVSYFRWISRLPEGFCAFQGSFRLEGLRFFSIQFCLGLISVQ